MTTNQRNDDTEKVNQGDAHPDASGFIQNSPDARGFAPGKEDKESDGMWHSNHPDSHGWKHSSTK